jgi:cyclopropane fatty-acyl-phospholipid synthase-like methyltransferase
MSQSMTPENHTDAVVRYYDETWFDYRSVWLNRVNNALHFGYESDGVLGHHHALQNGNAVCADIAGVRAGDRVLDAGCGIGGSARWLAEERGAIVVGITPVQSQIDRARQFAADHALGDRVRFEARDYVATGYPEASFEVAWAMESLCHAPDKAAFYREMHRVLAPGGRLVVAEYMRTRRDIAAADERRMRQWCDGWVMPDLLTGSEHSDAARAAGFGNVVVRDSTAYTRRSVRRLYHRTLACTPIDSVLYALGLRSSVQHGNVVASRLQYPLLLKDCWFYGILSATRD